jgi:hypothetical protein
VFQTYENIQKLMDYCKTVAPEQSNYVNVIDKFLRYKSDNDPSGWFIKNFIVLFQRKNDIELENEWRDGPIYVMEIELYDQDLYKEAMESLPYIHLSKFEYDRMDEWGKGCSPTNHWRFYFPLRNGDLMDFQQDGDSFISTPKDQGESDRYYWGVKRVTSRRIPLTDVTADHVVEKIFGTFDCL